MNKVAILNHKVFEANCPECGDSLENPVTGSFLFHAGEHSRETRLVCETCSTEIRLPKYLTTTASPA